MDKIDSLIVTKFQAGDSRDAICKACKISKCQYDYRLRKLRDLGFDLPDRRGSWFPRPNVREKALKLLENPRLSNREVAERCSVSYQRIEQVIKTSRWGSMHQRALWAQEANAIKRGLTKKDKDFLKSYHDVSIPLSHVMRKHSLPHWVTLESYLKALRMCGATVLETKQRTKLRKKHMAEQNVRRRDKIRQRWAEGASLETIASELRLTKGTMEAMVHAQTRPCDKRRRRRNRKAIKRKEIVNDATSRYIADRYRRGYRYSDYGRNLTISRDQHIQRVRMLKEAGKIPESSAECFAAACADRHLKQKLRALVEQDLHVEQIASKLDYTIAWIKRLIRHHKLQRRRFLIKRKNTQAK